MTNEEFSNAFDTLINAHNHVSTFGALSSFADVDADEYEKSLFLTLAQENILRAYFSLAVAKLGEGFDNTSKGLIDFSSLITVESINNKMPGATSYSDSGAVLDFTTLEKTPLYIINEKVTTSTNKSYVVIPIHYAEYDRVLSKAYPEPMKRLAWRLFLGDKDSGARRVEIVLRSDAGNFSKYTVRYIRKPRPIVLTDLENGLSISGVSAETTCELPDAIHLDILTEAVRLFTIAKGIESKEAKQAKEAQSK